MSFRRIEAMSDASEAELAKEAHEFRQIVETPYQPYAGWRAHDTLVERSPFPFEEPENEAPLLEDDDGEWYYDGQFYI